MTRPSPSPAALPRLSLLALGLFAAFQAVAQPAGDAAADAADAKDLDKVLVVAQRAERVSNGATNLDLAIKDTPQSISVVSREQMDNFGANNLNDALRLSPGIQVEEWETNRTNYISRGFEIVNTQIDGIGLPNGWGIVTGAMDSFGYDKIEVIRGANGLLTGVGNAAGTINYVRKRPTNDEEGSVSVSYGSWGTKRETVDYSSPITTDGTWAVRVVAAHEDGGSYLRDYDKERTYLYGVVDGQIGENGTLTAGYSYQQANSTGNMWGALTFNTVGGGQVAWDRSASTTQDWTYWNSNNQTGFLEYTHQLSDNWRLKLAYNYRRTTSDDQLFFAYTFTGLDPVTYEGLNGYPYKGQDKTTANLGTAELNGTYSLFGRDQEAMLGFSLAQSHGGTTYNPAFSGFDVLPGFPYANNVVAEPTWGDRTVPDTTNQRIKRTYGVTRVSLTERLKAMVGFNYTSFEREGQTGGVLYRQSDSHTSPYAGVTWDFSDDVLGYVSYSDIYQPQDQTDINKVYLDPTKGKNYEVGVKANWLDQRLLTTLAVFDAKQDGLATYRGLDPASGNYYYEPVDVQSRGVELEVTGKVTDNLDVVLGYTHLKMDGDNGDDTFPWVARNAANLAISARLPSYTALSYGVSARWQAGTTSGPDSYSGYTVHQDAYAIFNAFVGWNITDDLSLRVNANNIADKKYIGSLYQIGYYGAPRNTTATLEYRF
ncbi:outer-membrane receptor for ferric coprogen and ferric-rhodotorulic acid [Pseudoxanthomonas sp. GM95]|uniref:TonB-dependent siderophore receptor n=1 Tax=Pseudoxanthomonas sp. GM95 TaxID=1881043 RepID=UPI0008C1C05A|nr:TonB-dependent siderophore receptor [Pseudoxanthomonas sp. GM95]SEL70865.1 outer-membrane receptor for ferric coprogen and ferric-rhodotorulic acid [Pseudoxanthomonas sp. GM95]